MSEEASSIPCRLSVLLARSAPVAVILRRGPTKWVQMVRWQTDTDAFEAGQWFKGRVYDRRCDLSPDGSLLIYFASKITGRTVNDSEYTYAWTAISRPPYFTALALWPKGDCWHGGGLFLGPGRVLLNHRPAQAVPHPKHWPRTLKVEPNPDACGEDWPIWSRRMARDGWNLVQEGVFRSAPTKSGYLTEHPEIWERKNPLSDLVLRRTTDALNFGYPGGPYLESFRIVLEGGDVHLREAAWADWDQQGRLVFARSGKVFAARVQAGELIEEELVDLNGNTPSEVSAPDYARKW